MRFTNPIKHSSTLQWTLGRYKKDLQTAWYCWHLQRRSRHSPSRSHRLWCLFPYIRKTRTTGNGQEKHQARPDQSYQFYLIWSHCRLCGRSFVSALCDLNSDTSAKLWAVIYPIDMIKSRMQTDGFTPETGQKYKSAWDCVKTVWRTEGIGAFTRGLGPTLIRCVIFNLLYQPNNSLFVLKISICQWRNISRL